MTWSCSFHAQAIRHIRHLLSTDLAHTLVCSLILTRLDCCNSVLYGAPVSSIQKLQRVQTDGAAHKKTFCEVGASERLDEQWRSAWRTILAALLCSQNRPPGTEVVPCCHYARWLRHCSSSRSLALTSRNFFRCAICLELTSCVCRRKQFTVCIQV